MFSSSTLANWYEMSVNDSVLKDVYDINREANENLWTFSPEDDRGLNFTPEDLAMFIRAIAANRAQWLERQSVPGMVFYCWNDMQIRALRFSLVSVSHGRLPFGCEIRQVDDLLIVSKLAVNRDWNASYALDQLEPGDEEIALDVWTEAVS